MPGQSELDPVGRVLRPARLHRRSSARSFDWSVQTARLAVGSDGRELHGQPRPRQIRPIGRATDDRVQITGRLLLQPLYGILKVQLRTHQTVVIHTRRSAPSKQIQIGTHRRRRRRSAESGRRRRLARGLPCQYDQSADEA